MLFRSFDGVRPVSIGTPVREWFFNNVHTSYLYKTQGTYDRVTGNVYWFYVPRSNTSATLTAALVYNVKTQKWGHIDLTIEAVSEYIAEGVTYESLGTAYSTYDSLPTTVSYDSPFWTAGSPVLAIIDDAHTLYTMTGDSAYSGFTSENYGSEAGFTLVKSIKPRFIITPTSASIEYLYDNTYGNNFTVGNTVSISNSRFDLLQSSRWHKFNASFSGPVEISGWSIDAIQESVE